MIRYGVAHRLITKDSYFFAYCFLGRSSRHGPDPILERLSRDDRSSIGFLSSVKTLSQAMTSQQAFLNLFRDLTESTKSTYEQSRYLRHISRCNSELGRLELLFCPRGPSSVSELLDRAAYYAHQGWVHLAMDLLLFLLSDDREPRNFDVTSIDRIRAVWDVSLESPIIISALDLVKQVLGRLESVESLISLSGIHLFDCRLSIRKWHLTEHSQRAPLCMKTLLGDVGFLISSKMFISSIFFRAHPSFMSNLLLDYLREYSMHFFGFDAAG
jgi:hypothetical protein